jgi:hypothetical protein
LEERSRAPKVRAGAGEERVRVGSGEEKVRVGSKAGQGMTVAGKGEDDKTKTKVGEKGKKTEGEQQTKVEVNKQEISKKEEEEQKTVVAGKKDEEEEVHTAHAKGEEGIKEIAIEATHQPSKAGAEGEEVQVEEEKEDTVVDVVEIRIQ